MLKVQYFLNFKTYVSYKVLDNQIIITNNMIKIKSKKKIKKFIVKRSSFKYNKSQEQYALVYGKVNFSLPKNKVICPKFFEGFIFDSLNESNSIILKLYKKENLNFFFKKFRL